MLFFQKRNKEAEKIAREHQRPAWVRLPLMLFAAAVICLGLFSSPLVRFFTDVAGGMY